MRLESVANANGAYVYFMHHETEEMFKIGKAVDCQKRWNQLGNNFDFSKSFVKQFPSEKEALEYERKLHRTFSEKRLNLQTSFEGSTEWFCSSALPKIIEYVPDLVPVKENTLKPFQRKKINIYCLCDHWEHTLREILKELVANCEVSVKKDFIILNGEEAEKYSEILFNHSVRSRNSSFRVFACNIWKNETCFVSSDMDVIKRVYPEIFKIKLDTTS